MAQSMEHATAEQLYEEQLRKLLAAEKLPSSISAIRYEIGTDHIGEPAVRLFLVMDPQFQANFDSEQARRLELREFRSELRSKVLALDSTYYPFIRLVETS